MATSSSEPVLSAPDVIAPVLSAPTQDLKYMLSNFVSMKLSGSSNYNIWKAQMLCLLESQMLLHIINASHPFPVDKGVDMIAQYDKLVKGWIFGSMNGNVLKDFVSLQSARRVWMKLESLFNPAISYTKGDARTEDTQFMQAFNVEVSDFVSVKLSGQGEYPIWKAQMHGLIENQELLHIIDAEHPFPEDKGVHKIKQYDQLVKSWIFRSMDEKVLEGLVSFESAREVWMELESSFISPMSDREETQETEEFKYTQVSKVDVSKFVTVKLSGSGNYKIWKAQMLCLIESQDLHHIIAGEDPFLEDKYGYWVYNWIMDSTNKELSKDFGHIVSGRYVWMKLESLFNPVISYTDGDARTEELKYIQASSVNVSNFVSVKLSGRKNYNIWKTQMLGLINSQALLHIIYEGYPFPGDKGFHMIMQYEELVKGWIFGSMNEEVLKDFVRLQRSRELWMQLDVSFSPPKTDGDSDDSPGFMFGIESVRGIPEIGKTNSLIRRERLYEAAVEGCWWKAKSILETDKNAATELITPNGNKILHIVVEMGHNYFVEKLLEFLKDGNEIEAKNDKGRTALHIAAMVGNEYAAKLLVQKRKQLLEIRGPYHESPLEILSYVNSDSRKLNILAYLLESAISFNLDAGQGTWTAIYTAMFTKQYDLARTLLVKYPEAARSSNIILYAITTSFPTDLGYTESFIYPSFNNLFLKTVIRGSSLLFHDNTLGKCVDDILRIAKFCSNMCHTRLGNISMILVVPVTTLYPIYQLIHLFVVVLRLTFSMFYFILWKVLAVTVHPIKNIEKKKKEYEEAKKMLSLICEQLGEDKNGYMYTIFDAVRQDAYQVVDEILFRSPAIIKCKNEEGHNIIQLAIINRSEKVYNLIHHIIERTESIRLMPDVSENNLVHLAGRLAPSSVLDRTIGAALQLQRELIWREEVKKLMSPIELTELNSDKETPAMVFTREHEDLLKQGEIWMKTTAESCSITAALIITVIFAAEITVPGGSKQESGIPVFENEFAFTIFAIFNAFSLFTAATSLLLFLSILTTRFSEKDFMVSLPRRLIFGLVTLFLSTTAMIVAFGAVLFLVFCDQRSWMLAPICGFACLPISVIVTIKLPLLVDLIQSTYFPMFGKRSYLESCKINRKNTIFME